MAMDAGTYMWTSPANGQATDAANGAALAGATVLFMAQEGVDVVEIGAIVTVATVATALVVTASTAPAVGGTYTPVSTVTGPAAIIPVGTTLRSKSVKIHLDKGQMLRLVGSGPATGNGQLYAKVYPSGSRTVDVVSTT